MYEEQPSEHSDFEEFDSLKKDKVSRDCADFSDPEDFGEGPEEIEESDGPYSSLFIEVLDEQDEPVDASRIREVCEKILADHDVVLGRIGIVLVDHETIHELNREFLNHDYPTDVISFQVEKDAQNGLLEGEVIASVEMAKERAEEFQWTAGEELLLYVIHGLLHLVGYDDRQDDVRAVMREKERFYLRFLGIEPSDDGFDDGDSEEPSMQ